MSQAGSKWIKQEQAEGMDREAADNSESAGEERQLYESFDELHRHIAQLEQRYLDAIQGGEASVPQKEDDSPLSDGTASTERQILEVIEQYTLLFGKAHTGDIAGAVNLSRVQTWRYLKKLAAHGIIRRIGERGGWILADSDP
jgi:response regulator of citrate/malate metabolism